MAFSNDDDSSKHITMEINHAIRVQYLRPKPAIFWKDRMLLSELRSKEGKRRVLPLHDGISHRGLIWLIVRVFLLII